MNQDHGYGLCTHTSMSCCEIHGDCDQGRDCPVRTGIITPEQRAYMDAARLGGGNVWYAEPEPEFARFEGCIAMCGWALCAIAALIVIAGLAGYVLATLK